MQCSDCSLSSFKARLRIWCMFKKKKDYATSQKGGPAQVFLLDTKIRMLKLSVRSLRAVLPYIASKTGRRAKLLFFYNTVYM